ncbi:RfbB dTDP-D-glucose 4,6-dehydratase [uncultured Caudovirales phage]|uniref:RfbB dTDP-D-glucose 4,6-dehydratase n=1 Tax=uncultured Caudovirales phage TaxID=2100421 RepID=A0A6J5PHC8_9CAUD|nr:RfbB dTDP-D-glucose 4,6-dehydratase [uncultured Caudovirales phage]CAB4176631.1 RfbB dTDP-D-glucose 4,6-dehydratase [uncultured Caudovirales phage]CAB4181933.1 RfbB dTDP-D-glucose 4,6-dehydratase [uncultured Caudovirales phage]CAB4190335.1 RfbB dTDP-D-glucose 4,6-dehydratase [uncultured Caudovirales phage]CAB4210796.1 RfbB dTDP-D-glucose 4,6-dehydratase [uncultured Caudovirales phage]
MKKKVLVTGGAGFIAHHVIEMLLERTDWDIVTIDRLDFSGNLNRLHELMETKDAETRKRVRFVFHDLKAEINPLTFNNIGDCHYVLHLAAGSHVDRAILAPLEFVQDNVVGTCNILNYARQCKNLERFVYFSTDEVFGPAPKGVLYDERARYNSTNPYSATKAGGEELAVSFHNTYSLPVYICHTMNVFGQRQHPEKYVPKCIKNIRDGEMITVHADIVTGQPGSRFYVHVSDVADALMHILNLNESEFAVPDYGGAKCPKFNIVGNEEIDNLELAQIISKVMNKDLNYQLVDFNKSRPGHDLRYSLSGEYMKSLGWEPRVRLRDRIEEVVNWTLQHNHWLLA